METEGYNRLLDIVKSTILQHSLLYNYVDHFTSNNSKILQLNMSLKLFELTPWQ